MSILRKIFGLGKKEAAPEAVDAKVTTINSAPYKVEAPVAEPVAQKKVATPPIVKAIPDTAPAKVARVKKAPAAPKKKTTKTK